MKNPDRDPDHRRRREAGESGTVPNGKAVAEALYGGDPSAVEDEEEPDDEPTLFTDETENMPHPSKRKANRHEREIVREAQAKGLDAERAYASDGQSLGEARTCDVLVGGSGSEVMDALRIQAKRRKTIASYLEPPEGTDAVVVREDRGENLAVVPLDVLFRLLSERCEPPV